MYKIHTLCSIHVVIVASMVVCAASFGLTEAEVAMLLPLVRLRVLTRITDLVKAQ